MSTPGLSMIIVGISLVQWGCSVHRGDIMSTPWGYQNACAGYHEYTKGCSVHWRDPMTTPGVYLQFIMSTPGVYPQYTGGAEYTKGIP